MSADCMALILETALEKGSRVLFEPTSVEKSVKIVEASTRKTIKAVEFITPAKLELRALGQALFEKFGDADPVAICGDSFDESCSYFLMSSVS